MNFKLLIDSIKRNRIEVTSRIHIKNMSMALATPYFDGGYLRNIGWEDKVPLEFGIHS